MSTGAAADQGGNESEMPGKSLHPGILQLFEGMNFTLREKSELEKNMQESLAELCHLRSGHFLSSYQKKVILERKGSSLECSETAI